MTRMFKPWSRTASPFVGRRSARALTPDPPPSPDPQPAPDDDDDQLQVWAGAGTYAHAGPNLKVQALGHAGCGNNVGACMSGLFVASDDFVKPFAVSHSDHYGGPMYASGSIPSRVGRQVGRIYVADDGGHNRRIEIHMLSPDKETLGAKAMGCNGVFEHMYFAWLDDEQYSLCLAQKAPYVAGGSPGFDADPAHHTLLTFEGHPLFDVHQPYVEVTGALNADPSVDWVDIRVTLFGTVGMGKHGTTRRAWAYSQVAEKFSQNTWGYGSTYTNPLLACDGDPKPRDAEETWVVGWGWYKSGGKQYAAVTPPLCIHNTCALPGIGRVGEKLPDGSFTPAVYSRAYPPPSTKA
jgi:hypothetical protein